MNWYKKANKSIGDKLKNISSQDDNWYKISSISTEQISQKLKKLVKSTPFFISMMEDYNVPVSYVDSHLEISIKDLGKKHAEANSKEIILNKNLFENGSFFPDKILYFVHEFYHWVKRQSEKLFYFNDSEEVKAFTLCIAWELLRNRDINEVRKEIFPIVKSHFKNTDNAKDLFYKMVSDAKDIINKKR